MTQNKALTKQAVTNPYPKWQANGGCCTQRLLRAVVDGYPYNPGDSDLDNEQPITVRMTLGDYRLACALRMPERVTVEAVNSCGEVKI